MVSNTNPNFEILFWNLFSRSNIQKTSFPRIQTWVTKVTKSFKRRYHEKSKLQIWNLVGCLQYLSYGEVGNLFAFIAQINKENLNTWSLERTCNVFFTYLASLAVHCGLGWQLHWKKSENYYWILVHISSFCSKAIFNFVTCIFYYCLQSEVCLTEPFWQRENNVK